MRNLLTMLVFAQLASMNMGCKRNESPEQKPVTLRVETDFPVGSEYSNINRNWRPKKILYTKDMYELRNRKATKDEVKSLYDEQTEKEKKGQSDVDALKDKAEVAAGSEELKDLAKAILKFAKGKEITERSMDNLKQQLRRDNATAKRIYVDTNTYEIYDDDVSLRILLEREDLAAVLEADLNAPDNIIGYNKFYTGPGSAKLAVQVNLQPILINELEMMERIWKQELRMLWKAYMDYTAKTPPGQQNIDGFKAHLRATTPPSLAALVEKKDISVVNPAVANEWLACEKTINGPRGLYYAIKRNGESDYVSPAFREANFK